MHHIARGFESDAGDLEPTRRGGCSRLIIYLICSYHPSAQSLQTEKTVGEFSESEMHFSYLPTS